MEKIERIRELYAEISKISDEKMVAVNKQEYAEATKIRDNEKKLIDEIDDLVGYKGYYNEVRKMEEIDFHIENVETSLKKLKRLSFDLGNNFNVEIDAESLLALKDKRIKIQDELLNFKENLDVSEK